MTPVEQLVDSVHRGGPFPDLASAGNAVRATLGALGDTLDAHERRRLTEALPKDLGDLVPAGAGDPELTGARFYAQVARRLSIPPGKAAEEAQVVCQELVEHHPAVAEVFARHPLADCFRRPDRHGRTSAHPPPAPERAGTLAEGRPGSRRQPLSEGRADRAHQESIARTPNPHGETKLSSTTGTTQERNEETLASGEDPRERGEKPS